MLLVCQGFPARALPSAGNAGLWVRRDSSLGSLSKRQIFPMNALPSQQYPGKRAEMCPSQAKLHFLLSFCLLQGDAGIQGYPGRKVRREAPLLLNELSALMLSGIMAGNLWTVLEPPVELCSCWLCNSPTDSLLSSV